MSQPPPDAPIVLILGEESLLVREAEQKAVDQALGGGSAGFNLGTYGAEDGATGAISLALTLPMMARRRVVVIRHMDKAGVALLDDLLGYAENPNPSTTLVLSGAKLPGATGGMDRGKRLENRVKKVGLVQRFQAQAVHPGDFARKQAEARGFTLDPRATRMLIELVGNDLSQLKLELDKAINFMGDGGTISAEVVEAVCSVVSEAVVWDLTDAIIGRDPDKGLAAAHRMLEDAGSGGAHRLLSTITWQVRQLLELQDCLRRGEPEPGSWRRVPRRKLDDARNALQRRPLDPARVMDALTDANRAFNRAKVGERRIFEGLVLGLTTTGL